ncbi:MAG: xanthine dehydrogenase family protein [Candidatus Tectomicrobia bacterium]|nr:xanthine dehydrogenase family protein [Candidatus Tectomicrobia bacterium]
MADYRVAGKALTRIDTPDKAAGTACFGADVPVARALVGRVLGSPHAFARVLSVDASRARRIPGVRYVLTREECPGIRFGGDIKDQSWLAKDGCVRYVGEPVAAVAAETLEAAQAALEAVRVRYAPLAPVVDPIASREGRTLLLHEDWKQLKLGPGGEGNVLARFEKTIGSPDSGFARADRVFEHTFLTPHAHAGYIEPHACTAEAGADGKVTIWTTTQDAWAIRADVAEALGLPATKVRVIPTEIGGGFGSKLKSTFEHIAALLALRTGQAVRMEMSREEDHRGVNPRHPHVFTIKTGVKRDGTMVARELDVTMEHGAYGRGAPFQCSSKMGMASSVYRIPDVRVKACTVYTNAPVAGPVRAPSGPQYHFATEVHTDIIARELGIDPLEFRRLNALRPGDKSLAGTHQDGSMQKVMERAAAEGRWGQPVPRRADLPEEEGWRYGRGIACGFWHGPGEASSCSVRLNGDGSLQVMSGTVNLTGASTSLCQLAAESLGVRLDNVRYTTGDTDTVPESTAASGSKATRSVGAAVLSAVRDLRKKILDVAGAKLEAAPGDLVLEDGKVKVASAPERSLTLAQVAKAAPEIVGFLIGQGASPKPPACPIYIAQVAEVAVRPELGEVRVLRLVCVQDVGFAINPLSVEGQIEGAMVQGMGLALMEEQFRHPDGRLGGESLHEYLLPTSMDMPELKAILFDNPAEGTPLGMRGVGEPPIVATAAAIVNAIQDAAGVPFFSIPVGPHHLRKALAAAGNGA